MIEMIEVDGRRWYIKDNQPYPSSSSVLDVLFPSDKSFVPEDALVRGAACHAEIASALVATVTGGQHDWRQQEEVVSRRAGKLYMWCIQNITEILAVESRNIFMGVGLTVDFIGRRANGKKCLWDWKFAESVSQRYFYQAEFYRRAEGCDEAAIIQIDRECSIVVHHVPPDERRWEKIKSAINVRNHLDEKEIANVKQQSRS